MFLSHSLYSSLARWLSRGLSDGLHVNNFLLSPHYLYIKDIYSYNLCFFLATYVLPTIGMGLCYAQMGLHLYRGDKTILQLVLIPPAALNKSRQDKKRIVIMFAVVITIFIVCWAPYHVYFLLVYHLPSITQYQHIGNNKTKSKAFLKFYEIMIGLLFKLWPCLVSNDDDDDDDGVLNTECSGHVYLCFYWLAMSNSCVNPIIYYWMNMRFRAYFNKIFCFLPMAVRKSVRFISKSIRNCWSREDRRSPGTSSV